MKTVEQIAKEKNKSTRWIRYEIEKGRHRSVKLGGTWVILESHEMVVDVRTLPIELKNALLAHAQREADKLIDDLRTA